MSQQERISPLLTDSLKQVKQTLGQFLTSQIPHLPPYFDMKTCTTSHKTTQA